MQKDYLKYYTRYNEINKELKENYGDDKERQRKIDLLKYQINEIEVANLKEGEEEQLEEKRKIIMNSEKIAQSLNEADMAIGENTIDLLSTSIRALEKIEQIDKKYEQTVSGLKSVYYELQEISKDISSYREDTYFDEQERNEIEERLNLIYDLKRKYGNSIKEILEYNEEIKLEIDKIENLEERNNKLKKEQKELKQKMIEIASHSSTQEKNADKCERESNKMKTAEYMENYLDEEYEATIISFTNGGMFVQLPNLVEGRVGYESLNDFYNYDPDLEILIGEKSHNVYRLGDKVAVKLIKADKDLREIDFEILPKPKVRTKN